MSTPSRYAAAFAPRDPSELAADARRAAVASVQASLYGRLRREFGASGAGTIAWMLLHSADRSHRSHVEAYEALAGRSHSELCALHEAAEGAVKAARTESAREVASSVLATVTLAIAAGRAAAGRAAGSAG